MKRAAALSIALAFACALAIASSVSAQEPREPLIDPPSGAAGSRFQIVGQAGWTAGETVTIEFAFADADPGSSYAGPFEGRTQQVTVLRDGSWSFPTVVNDELFPFPLWRPGYIVVRASSASKTATSSYRYLISDTRGVATVGFGPTAAPAPLWATLALFAGASGGLLVVSGRLRSRAS